MAFASPLWAASSATASPMVLGQAYSKGGSFMIVRFTPSARVAATMPGYYRHLSRARQRAGHAIAVW
jgi:hypothetical protein